MTNIGDPKSNEKNVKEGKRNDPSIFVTFRRFKAN